MSSVLPTTTAKNFVKPVILIIAIMTVSILLVSWIARAFKLQGSEVNVDASQSRSATNTTHNEAYGRIEMAFESNRGQTDGSVDFLARGVGYTLFLRPEEAVMTLA